MQVNGPVTGGARGGPSAAPRSTSPRLGYEQDEYFFGGDAARYGPAPGTQLGRDGRWQVRPGRASPYESRMVIVRPVDPADFNGTVIVLWNNVSAGYENFGGGDSAELFEGGYAYVAVSVQRVGVHGQPDNPQGLRSWDPDRYGSLSIPSDDYSFDIFTQAADLVAPDRPRDHVDLMGGLEVRRLIAQGASQSAARLASYLNGIQPITRRFDAFFLVMYFGGGTPLEVGDAVMTVRGAAADATQPGYPKGCTCCATTSTFPSWSSTPNARRPPATGSASPTPTASGIGRSPVLRTSPCPPWPRPHRGWSGTSASRFRSTRRCRPSIRSPSRRWSTRRCIICRRWVRDGTPPPIHPRIAFEGDPAQIVRDDNGIARGGIRLPQVEVPLAHNSALQRTPDLFARLVGSHEPFPVEKVRELYGSRDGYLARYEDATRAAASASVVLPRDVDALLADAVARLPL